MRSELAEVVRRLRRFFAVSCFFCLIFGQGIRPAMAQTVQLPTRHVFGGSTSVWVPDGGSTYLGGVGRSAYGSTSRGTPLLGGVPLVDRLFRNRAIGSSQSATGVAVHATIIDLQEADQAVLAAAAAQRETPSARSLLIARKANELNGEIASRDTDALDSGKAGGDQGGARGTADRNAWSVSAIRRQNEQAAAVANEEARSLLDQGRAAESAGKVGVAKIYYQMAARRGQDDVRDEALGGLERLAAWARAAKSKANRNDDELRESLNGTPSHVSPASVSPSRP
jgi:hypothetical protein